MIAMNRRSLSLTFGAAVIVATIVAVLVTIGVGSRDKHAVAYFDKTVNLYVNDEVRVLGVRVGKVAEITPDGTRVRVDIAYDRKVTVPANAGAVIVAPTLVTGRFVQLTPVYAGGPVLPDEGIIPKERTVVPVEWDEVMKQVDRVAEALGPQGANADGSLSRLLRTSAANLDGNGEKIGQTIHNISEAMATLSDGRDDLFGTVRNLQVFTSALAGSDAQVEEFTHRLAAVSNILDTNKQKLADVLKTLSVASRQVTDFARDNRNSVGASVDKLAHVTDALAAQQNALALLLHYAPTGLANLYNIYDPLSGGLTGRLAPANLGDPASFVCSAAVAVAASSAQQEQTCAQALAPLLNVLAMESPPVAVDPIQRNGPEKGKDFSDPFAGSRPGDTNVPGSSGLGSLLMPGGTR